MAIAPSPRNLDADRSRIRSPLARLRKYVRGYVSLEGAAFAALFVALWFWIGLLLDYGFFKLTLIDWVQTVPWGFRAGVLGVVLAALAALLITKIVFRLLREFSDAAMALLLERKFPQQLGDRLITAVEMSDPRQAEQYGYSAALVKETIHEAADRVDSIPVGQVFDWKRLVRQGGLVALLTLGVGAFVGAGFCAARQINNEDNPAEGFADFAEVAGIWAERNVLLRNTIWPRRAYLEILPWERARVADDGTSDPYELRIPQGSVPPALRVRAWKYIVADPGASEGWRLLSWADLQERPELSGYGQVPDVPEGWAPRDAKAGFTVDEVELLLEAFPVRKIAGRWEVKAGPDEWQELRWSDLTRERLAGLDVPALPAGWDPGAALAGAMMRGDPLAGAARVIAGPKVVSLTVTDVEKKLEADPNHPAVRKALDRLTQLADIRAAVERVGDAAGDRAMRRTMRKLVVPDTVTLTYRGPRTTSTSPMTRIAGNEFTGNFAELKESVTFTARGEDYVTPTRSITVVERPRVEELQSEEERPAYLYYRPSGDIAAADLRGKRQPLEPIRLSVSGDTTTTDVPAGTHVTLTVTVSKPLRSFDVAVEAKDQKNFRAEKPQKVDEQRFKVVLPDVRREQRFKLVFEDTDEVVGERKVVLQPKEDTNPRVREFNPDEVIRRGRGNEGYIVAVGARIPFKGRVADDHGLARVRFACRVTPADFLSEQKLKALFGVGGVPLFGPGSGGPMLAAGYLLGLHKDLTDSKSDDVGPEQYLDVPAFVSAMSSHRPREGELEFLERATVLDRLAARQREPYRKLMREFQLSPDNWLEKRPEVTRIGTEVRLEPWVKPTDAVNAPLVCDLPLWKLTWRDRDGKDKPLRDPDETRAQKRFIIEVRLLVEDTYLDGDPAPHVSPSGETFTFVVSPENELLARIGEEEEAKYRELQKAFKPLPENLDRLRDMNFALTGGPGGIDAALLNSFLARCDTLTEALMGSHADVTGVYKTYDRIVNEMRTNDVREDMLSKVYKGIFYPLEEVSTRQFDATKNAVKALRQSLDNPAAPVAERVAAAAPKAAEARKQLNDLVAQLNAILSAMEGITKLNELIAELARIEKQEEDLEGLVSRLLRKRIEEELKVKD
jgi:hypothetical protein